MAGTPYAPHRVQLEQLLPDPDRHHWQGSCGLCNRFQHERCAAAVFYRDSPAGALGRELYELVHRGRAAAVDHADDAGLHEAAVAAAGLVVDLDAAARRQRAIGEALALIGRRGAERESDRDWRAAAIKAQRLADEAQEAVDALAARVESAEWATAQLRRLRVVRVA